ERGDTAGALEQLRAARAITAEKAAAHPDDLQALADLADADDKLGDTLGGHGDSAGALAAYEASRDEATRLVAGGDAPGHRRVLMVAQFKLAQIHRGRGEAADASKAARAALAIAQENAAHDPANLIWQRDVELTEQTAGDVLRDAGDLDGAAPYYDGALAAAKTLASAHPDNADWQYDLANAYDRSGDLARRPGDPKTATDRFRAGLATRAAPVALDPKDPSWQRGLSVSHHKLAEASLAADRPDDAVTEARAAVAITERLAAADPSNHARASDLATVE